jgi:hypothetical protein
MMPSSAGTGGHGYNSSSCSMSHPTSNTNFYISTLAKELATVCWQHTTNTGDLATGGLGGWTWLQYQASFHCAISDGEQQRMAKLLAARDAAEEALKAIHRTTTAGSVSGIGGVDDSDDDALCFDDTMIMMMPENPLLLLQSTSQHPHLFSSSIPSMSIHTNPFLGCHAMLAVILYQLGEGPAKVQHHVHNVLQFIRRSLQGLIHQQQQSEANNNTKSDSRCDVWYGMAGAMQTIFFLRQHLQQETLGRPLVIALARRILSEGRTVARRVHREWINVRHNDDPVGYDADYNINQSLGLPLLWMYQGTIYLGGIHGVAGICTSLLGLSNDELDLIEHHSSARQHTQRYSFNGQQDETLSLSNARQLVQQTIDGLQRHCFVSGNLRKTFDGTLNEVDQYSCWSHGAGGYVMLLLRSHEVFGDTVATTEEVGYLRQAQNLAEKTLWARRLTLTKRGGGGIGLTTGIAGVAYVFIRLAQVLMRENRPMESQLWKQRAEQLARHAVNHWRELLVLSSNSSHNPYSVMEGLGGLVSLLFDLNGVEEAQFPFNYQPGTVTSITIDSWRTDQQQEPYLQAREPTHPNRKTERNDANSAQLDETKKPGQLIPKPPDVLVKPPSKAPMKPKSNLPSLKDTAKVLTSTRMPAASSAVTPEAHVRAGGSHTSAQPVGEDEAAPHVHHEELQELDSGNLTILSYSVDGSSSIASPMLIDHNSNPKTGKKTGRETPISFDAEPAGRTYHPFGKTHHELLETQVSEKHVLSADEQHTSSRIWNLRNVHQRESTADIQSPNPDDVADKAHHGMKASTDDLVYDRSQTRKNPSLLDEEGHAGSSNVGVGEEYDEESKEGISEFKSAHPDDEPDKKYLRRQDSKDESFFDNKPIVKPLLDEEEHGVASEKFEPQGDVDNEQPEFRAGRLQSNDQDEFAESKEHDLPKESYLRMQDSSDDLYFETETLGNHPILDEETHSSRRFDEKSSPNDEHDYTTVANRPIESAETAHDDDEFQLPDDQATFNSAYMRRQDSADELYFAFSSALHKQAILDDENHCAHLSALVEPESSDDLIHKDNEAEEFQAADRSDQPDEEYLRMQGSTDELSMLMVNGHHTAAISTLDEDRHTSIGMDHLVRSISRENLVEDFEEPYETDKPDKRYLSKQDSQHELYYEYYTDQEKLAAAKADLGLLAKEVAEVAAGSTIRSPKRKSTTTRISKETPPRHQARCTQVTATPATTATVAMTTTPHNSPPWKPAITSSIASLLSPALVDACLKDAEGEGNILNGGLGVSVFLRIKLSELETGGITANERLQEALKYALSAVEDALAETSRKPYPSILSSDVIGAQCMLISLLNRLGRRKDACRLANATVVKLVELHEMVTKHDCSVIFGLAGALQTIWFLRNELDDEEFGRDYVLTVSSAILMEGLKHPGKYQTDASLLWEWHERPFLGAGTGATGILHALLGHSEEEWSSLDVCLPQVKQVIRKTIDSLGDLKHPSGNLMAAIDRIDEDRSTDWNHGAPGYCLLLLRAFEVFEDQKYLTQAKNLAENVIWPRRMQRRGLGLARGVSGVAYVFMALARVDTGNSEIWRTRASKMAAMAVSDLEELQAMSKHPNSLFEGLGGLISLLIDLERSTSDVYFPFFEHQHFTKNCHRIESRTVMPCFEGESGNHQRHDDKLGEDSQPSYDPNRQSSPRPRNDGSSGNTKKSHLSNAGKETTHTNHESLATTTTAPMSEPSKTTPSWLNQQYGTPPRRDGPKRIDAVSPITEPSSGVTPARPGSSRTPKIETLKVSRYVQTKRLRCSTKETQTKEDDDEEAVVTSAKKLVSHQRQSYQYHRPRRLDGMGYYGGSPNRCSPKVWPPQVKRHIYTHADDVSLAKRATVSWTAKIQSSTAGQAADDNFRHHDDADAFTSDSVERLQRAEASWFKRKTMLIGKTSTITSIDGYGSGEASVGSSGSSKSIRKLVGGFEGC